MCHEPIELRNYGTIGHVCASSFLSLRLKWIYNQKLQHQRSESTSSQPVIRTNIHSKCIHFYLKKNFEPIEKKTLQSSTRYLVYFSTQTRKSKFSGHASISEEYTRESEVRSVYGRVIVEVTKRLSNGLRSVLVVIRPRVIVVESAAGIVHHDLDHGVVAAAAAATSRRCRVFAAAPIYTREWELIRSREKNFEDCIGVYLCILWYIRFAILLCVMYVGLSFGYIIDAAVRYT